MKTTRPDDRIPDDEATLAPFFAAARLDDPRPSRALLSAILADAGVVGAARAAAAAPAAAVLPRRRRFLAVFGGWRVATALAAASIFGFWVGLSGTVDVRYPAGWTTATAEPLGDPVAGFFDLASAE